MVNYDKASPRSCWGLKNGRRSSVDVYSTTASLAVPVLDFRGVVEALCSSLQRIYFDV